MTKSLKISKPALSTTHLLKGFLFLITLSLCTHLFSNNTASQNHQITFESDSIQALYNMLPENIKTGINLLNIDPSKPQVILNTRFQDDTMQLNVRFNAYSELAHVGMYLFPIERSDLYYIQVFEFVEKEILRYHILGEDDQILERMKITETALFINGEDYHKSHYGSILSVCALLQGAPFILDANDNEYAITWKLNSVESLTMQFPNNYLIVSGKRKDEIEKEISRDLKNLPRHVDSNYIEIKENHNNYNGRIDTLIGEHYEGSAEITSDTYYYADSQKPVYDTIHVKGSLSNLLLNAIPTNIDLDISHNLYGNATDQYSINLNDFMNYFSTEHKIYCKVNDSIGNNLQASIFIYNVLFNYIHLLTITTNLNELITNANINGVLYTFIRNDNVKKQN